MAIGAVMVVTLFVGVNISTWTAWVFGTLGIEILIIWVYTVRIFLSHCALVVINDTVLSGCLLRD